MKNRVLDFDPGTPHDRKGRFPLHQQPAVTRPHLSIVIPVYNESRRIEHTLDQVEAWLTRHGVDAEVLVVDDGSTDCTADVVRARDIAHERLIHLPHGGKARAVLHGLREARGDIIGFMDADLATPVDTLAPMLAALDGGADLAIASREGAGAERVKEPWYRHAMGRVFNALVQAALLPGIQDTQCGFKFMTRDARDAILPRVRLYTSSREVTQPRVTAFDVELLYISRRLGMTLQVLPITWVYGEHSKVNPVNDTLQNLRDVAAVWVNGRRGRYRR